MDLKANCTVKMYVTNEQDYEKHLQPDKTVSVRFSTAIPYPEYAEIYKKMIDPEIWQVWENMAPNGVEPNWVKVGFAEAGPRIFNIRACSFAAQNIIQLKIHTLFNAMPYWRYPVFSYEYFEEKKEYVITAPDRVINANDVGLYINDDGTFKNIVISNITGNGNHHKRGAGGLA